MNGTGPGLTYPGLSTVEGAPLPVPTGLGGNAIDSLSADGSAFAYRSGVGAATVHRATGDVTVTPPGFDWISTIDGISADGTTIVGTETNGTFTYPFRWSDSEGFVKLGPYLQINDRMHAVSDNGGDVVGGDKIGMIWSGVEAGRPVGPSGYRYASAMAVGWHGQAAAGTAVSAKDSTSMAYRWTSFGGPCVLGHLSGFANSSALYISDDAKVVVGEVWGPGQPTPYIWTSASGMKLLRDLIPAGGETLMNPDGPIHVSGMSGDGRVLIGGTYDRTGRFPEHAWVARLTLTYPAP